MRLMKSAPSLRQIPLGMGSHFRAYENAKVKIRGSLKSRPELLFCDISVGAPRYFCKTLDIRGRAW
jgi:hypothetical protein